MPDATEKTNGFQDMTHLECPICSKKCRMNLILFSDGIFFCVYNSDGVKTGMADANEILKDFESVSKCDDHHLHLEGRKNSVFFFL